MKQMKAGRTGERDILVAEIYKGWDVDLTETISRLKESLKDVEFSVHNFRGETTIIVKNGDLHKTLEFFKNDGFDYLVDVSSSHYPERGEIEVIYLIRELKSRRQIRVKSALSVENPMVLSACDLWRGADWFEREVYDLMGVIFEGHPDLRRIMMPEDFEDFPLRKQYPMEGDDEWRNFLKPGEGE